MKQNNPVTLFSTKEGTGIEHFVLSEVEGCGREACSFIKNELSL